MFQTVTNFLFSRSSGGFENKKSDNNNLKSFKSFDDFSDLKKKGETQSSKDCRFSDRSSFSCDLPFVVSDDFDMGKFNMVYPLPNFSQDKKEFKDVKGSSRLTQPKTVCPKFDPNQNSYTPSIGNTDIDIQQGSNNCFGYQLGEETITNGNGNGNLPEVDISKIKSPETKTSLSELRQPQPVVKPSKLTKTPSKLTGNNASFKDFSTKKKISPEYKKLSIVIPDLDLEFDHISTNLEKIQTRYSISFVDKKSKQPLLIHINCKYNTRKVSQEELINFVMTGSICVRSFPESQTRYKRLIADSCLFKKIHVLLIYPPSDQEICDHKGEKKNYRSVPSESYTQYRKDKNQQDLNNTWIRGVLCRSPNEESYFREYSYINNIGRIQFGKSPGKKNELLMIPLFTLPEEEETLPSLRDVSGIHLDFMRKIEQQKNELFSPYLNGDGKIHIYTDLHPTIYVLHFKISLQKHSSLEELSDIIENLSKNKNYYKDLVINNVRLSNLDPLAHIFKESVV